MRLRRTAGPEVIDRHSGDDGCLDHAERAAAPLTALDHAERAAAPLTALGQ